MNNNDVMGGLAEQDYGPVSNDPWIIGAAAGQDTYRPLGNDPWTNTMIDRNAQQKAYDAYSNQLMQQQIMPDRGIPYGAMTPQEENIALPERDQAPQSPFDAAMMMGGPFRGAAMIGGALTSASPAEAARLKVPTGFDPSTFNKILTTTRGPPRGVLSLEDFGPTPAESTKPINPMAVKGHNVPPKDYRMQFPQYATEYPPVGPPSGPFINEDKLKKYLGQGLSEEAATAKAQYFEKLRTPQEDEFMRARKKVWGDMQKQGYVPFFNPVDRYHVDPTDYPPTADTMQVTDKVRATNMAKVDTPEARAALQAGFERGKSMPNTENWYAMGQLEQAFIDELGPVAGKQAFQDRFAGSMAASTGGADPTSNFLTAMYGNFLRERGKDVPQIANQHPSPIGGRFIQGNVDMQQKMIDAGGNSYLGGDFPKRHNFSQNFTGNQGVGTIDEQMMGGFTGHLDKPLTMPPPGHYGLYEQVLRDEAAKAGMTPQEYQAITWSGLKNMSTPTYTRGKSMIEHVNDSIERTARLTGLTPEEVVKQGIIRSKIPLYALASGMAVPAAMGSLARQSNQPEERM
jgi:hypothetical protein